MQVEGEDYRTIWLAEDGESVAVIDQTKLPHRFEVMTLTGLEEAARAIETMVVRGAPLIGATAAYGMALALRESATDAALEAAHARLLATRPTAVNLRWALERLQAELRPLPVTDRAAAAYASAAAIAEEDVEINAAIGRQGLALLRAAAAAKPGQTVNVLTHCNAGWLATVDWGTATAPLYLAQREGIPLHVWVDETRPRNQGAALTAWELGQQGLAHSVIADNTGGHLMQHGQVDLVITGTDRTTGSGDVANKIGTYLKALAAKDNGVPFYVALPSPTIDFSLDDGVAQIPIEERSGEEVASISGRNAAGEVESVRLLPDGSSAVNYAFDVTPARLVTGLITEAGIAEASKSGLAALFPERAKAGR
ncbi:MAG: S-methyl-5-thioribose-1-phosphate isomerase [Rhodospirillales bacterium]